jgi:hypothetical protein
MPTLEAQYEQLVKLAQADPGVIGFILGGGRGKGISTEHSDYDILIIVENAIADGAKVKYKPYAGLQFDITIMTERELSIYGVWGSDTMWARYGFAHVTAVIDKKKDLQQWLNVQETIPTPALDEAIKEALDSYLSYTHRSLKNFRDGRATAAHLAACDAMPQLITFLFAAEGRVRPYNEYIDWELTTHPLKNLAMDSATFNKKIGTVLSDGSIPTQKEFLALVQGIAAKLPVGPTVLKSWEGYYFG